MKWSAVEKCFFKVFSFFCLLLLFSMLSALCAVALCSRIAAMSGAYAALKGISKLF